MTRNEKAIRLIKRYKRVKNYIKNAMSDTDLNTYVQQLVQANRLKTELVTELIKS